MTRPEPARYFDRFRTHDGHYGSGEIDLFATATAVGALALLDEKPTNADATLQRVAALRAPAGGFAFRQGTPADLWASGYASSILTDLGVGSDVDLGSFLSGLRTPTGYRMGNSEGESLWSNSFAARAAPAAAAPSEDPDPIGAVQQEDGGLSWWPEARRPSDVRAALQALQALAATPTGVRRVGEGRRRSLVAWLRDQQMPCGGFRLNRHVAPCLWATRQALEALHLLGSTAADPKACWVFVAARRRSDGGYARGPQFAEHSDVWATTAAVTAAHLLHRHLSGTDREATVAFLRSCELPDGGHTYRPPHLAADVLATSAAILSRAHPRPDHGASWLLDCRMPGEEGVAFMPNRGAEARSAQWAAAAIHTTRPAADLSHIGRWATRVQNPDGGFPLWEGRASTITATAAILDTLTDHGLDPHRYIDMPAAARYAQACDTPGPGGDLVATLQLHRIAATTGAPTDTTALLETLNARRAPSGGWTRHPRPRIPDLITTYQALQTLQHMNRLDAPHLAHAAALVQRLTRPDGGTAWSPTSPGSSGPLASALATLINTTATNGTPLPTLNL